MIERILKAFALGLDYALEITCFWRAYAPTTVSSQCGLALRRGERYTLLALLGRLLNRLQKDHCEGSILDDIQRAYAAIHELT